MVYAAFFSSKKYEQSILKLHLVIRELHMHPAAVTRFF